jgi:hypothetical protein
MLDQTPSDTPIVLTEVPTDNAIPQTSEIPVTNSPDSPSSAAKSSQDLHLEGLDEHGKGNYRSAITRFDLAIAMDHKSAEYFKSRALSRMKLGEFADALNDLKEAQTKGAQDLELYIKDCQNGLAKKTCSTSVSSSESSSQPAALEPVATEQASSTNISFSVGRDQQAAPAQQQRRIEGRRFVKAERTRRPRITKENHEAVEKESVDQSSAQRPVSTSSSTSQQPALTQVPTTRPLVPVAISLSLLTATPLPTRREVAVLPKNCGCLECDIIASIAMLESLLSSPQPAVSISSGVQNATRVQGRGQNNAEECRIL